MMIAKRDLLKEIIELLKKVDAAIGTIVSSGVSSGAFRRHIIPLTSELRGRIAELEQMQED
jgi:hypothetical protein